MNYRTKTCNAIPKPVPKIICQCPRRINSVIISRESKAKKIINRVTPNSRCMRIIEQPIFCICVKKSSSEDLKKLCKCSSTCTFLSKYNDCCCIREKVNETIDFYLKKKKIYVCYYIKLFIIFYQNRNHYIKIKKEIYSRRYNDNTIW